MPASLTNPTRAASHPPAAPIGPEAVEAEVGSYLADLLECERRLLEVVREHRAAISSADPARVRAAVERHGAATEELGRLEERRARMTSRALGPVVPGEPARTIGRVIERAPAGSRGRLGELAGRVREVAVEAQREQAALGQAALALAGHMQGLVRGVAARVSEAGTYGRRGFVEAGGRLAGALDLSR